MRKETIEKKKKSLKNKNIIENIIKENGINKSLSTVEKNKLILRSMAKDTNNQEEEIETIKVEKEKTSIREFKCGCGFSVQLEGDIAKDGLITKCSVCRSK